MTYVIQAPMETRRRFKAMDSLSNDMDAAVRYKKSRPDVAIPHSGDRDFRTAEVGALET